MFSIPAVFARSNSVVHKGVRGFCAAANFASASAERSRAITRAPSRSSRSVVAFPMPLAAPVTSAIGFDFCFMLHFELSELIQFARDSVRIEQVERAAHQLSVADNLHRRAVETNAGGGKPFEFRVEVVHQKADVRRPDMIVLQLACFAGRIPILNQFEDEVTFS